MLRLIDPIAELREEIVQATCDECGGLLASRDWAAYRIIEAYCPRCNRTAYEVAVDDPAEEQRVGY